MEDIWCSQAWQCGEKGCAAPGGWHKRTFWTTDRGGFTCDEYSDGDHDHVDDEDVPSVEECDRSWRDYAEWVLANGKDPLGEFLVKHTNTVHERWAFRFNNSILGPVLMAARHNNKHFSGRHPEHLPEHVRQYLNLSPTGQLQDFKTWDDFVAVVNRIRPTRWAGFTIEWQKPRRKDSVRKELREAAKRHLNPPKKETLNAA